MIRTRNKSLSPNSQQVSAVLGVLSSVVMKAKTIAEFRNICKPVTLSPGRSSKRKAVSHRMPVLCQRCKFTWREQLPFYGIITGPNNLYFSLPFCGNIDGPNNLYFSLQFYGNITGPNNLYFSLPLYGNISGPNNLYFSLPLYGNITEPNTRNLYLNLPLCGDIMLIKITVCTLKHSCYALPMQCRHTFQSITSYLFVGFKIMEHKINFYTQFSCVIFLTLTSRWSACNVYLNYYLVVYRKCTPFISKLNKIFIVVPNTSLIQEQLFLSFLLPCNP